METKVETWIWAEFDSAANCVMVCIEKRNAAICHNLSWTITLVLQLIDKCYYFWNHSGEWKNNDVHLDFEHGLVAK